MSIINKFESYLSFSQAALDIKARRVQIISENIVNASTPGFKAKDIDFAKLLNQHMANSRQSQDGSVDGGRVSAQDIQSSTYYRVPLSPSVDNNTVEIGVEQAKFGHASSDYQASLQMFESKLSGLFKALRGE